MIIMDSHFLKNLFTSEEGKNREKTRKEWNEELIFYQENITFSEEKSGYCSYQISSDEWEISKFKLGKFYLSI